MEDLAQFLRDRLDDDERVARRGYYSETHWELFTTEAHLRAWHAWREIFPREQWDVKANDTISEAARDGIRDRITAHEDDRAARALLEVDAKRKLLVLHRPVTRTDLTSSTGEPAGPMVVCHECDANTTDDDWPDRPCWTLRYLALPYANHPGYRQEWRP